MRGQGRMVWEHMGSGTHIPKLYQRLQRGIKGYNTQTKRVLNLYFHNTKTRPKQLIPPTAFGWAPKIDQALDRSWGLTRTRLGVWVVWVLFLYCGSISSGLSLFGCCNLWYLSVTVDIVWVYVFQIPCVPRPSAPALSLSNLLTKFGSAALPIN